MLLAGRDLRAIFALLRKDSSGRIPQRSVLLLLRSLTAMARHLGPTTFFNFADDGAGIMRNTPLRFSSASRHSPGLCPSAAACMSVLHLLSTCLKRCAVLQTVLCSCPAD